MSGRTSASVSLPAVSARATRRGIAYRLGQTTQHSIDVLLGGRRVWSFTVSGVQGDKGVQPWPEALQPRLKGSAVCELRSSADGARLWSGVVRWGGRGEPDLSDSLGRDVVINKWGRLSHSFEGDGGDAQQRIMSLAERVLETLESLGLSAFVVGGTLLGAVRDGALLPHDDDADVAYLSEHSHPSELVLESARIEQAIRFRGLRVIRHSWAHLQIAEVARTGETEFYVDVFTAFVRNGEFCEPIHMRGPAENVRLLPLGSVSIGDRTYPAPGDPESWLSACYGPNWRTPDPGFSFETPADTVRRFYSWFGNFNLHRSTWNDAYLAGADLAEDIPIRDFEAELLNQLGDSGALIDLGAGRGGGARRALRDGHAVRCIDYAWSAPCHDDETLHSSVVNLTNYSEAVLALQPLVAELRGASRDGKVVAWANRLLACQDPQARGEILLVLGFLVRTGVRVFVCDYESLGNYSFDRPTSWHLTEKELHEEAAARGLAPSRIASALVRDERGDMRAVAMYELRIGEEERGIRANGSNDEEDLR